MNTQESRVFKLGAIAAVNKKKVGDNPYHENDRDHWKWMNGFSFILANEKELNDEY